MKSKLFFLAVLAATFPVAAHAEGTNGARIEARLGYETPTVSGDYVGDDDVYKLGSAVSYGGEIGYDLKVSEKITVGPYVNYELSSVKNCEDGSCVKVKNTFSAGARIGYVVSPKGVIYAKLGYANMRVRANIDDTSVTEGHGGIQGALGYEGNFSKNAYWKVEGVYSDNGELFDIPDLNVQRRQLVVGVGMRF